jgi:hypothetical protein
MTLREIMIEVAIKHRLRIEDIRARSKVPKLVRARQEFCYRALNETGRTSGEIGFFIRREHATVLWAAARFCRSTGFPPPRGIDYFAKSYRWGHWSTWPSHRHRLEARATT